MSTLECVMVGLMGLGLSAACGFRVFVPLLITSVAVKAGMAQFAPGFAWMGSNIAIATFAVATVLEVSAYYVPWLDHALDVVATPCAIIAGTILSASLITGLDPTLKWTLAVVAGGGAAGVVQGMTVTTRVVSTSITGGLGNWLVATCEAVLAMIVSLLAIVLPILAILAITTVLLYIVSRMMRRRAPIAVQAA